MAVDVFGGMEVGGDLRKDITETEVGYGVFRRKPKNQARMARESVVFDAKNAFRKTGQRPVPNRNCCGPA
jgi:hypothetical protein